MSENEDLALLLESDTLELIRILAIFLVFAIALFSFTTSGKIFCIISLLISFTINVTLVINYYIERNRIIKLGFYPKRIVEIVVFIMIIVALFTLWILYEVIQTEPVSLSSIAENIENKMEENNITYTENIKNLLGKSDLAPLKHTDGKISENLLKVGENTRVNVSALASSA